MKSTLLLFFAATATFALGCGASSSASGACKNSAAGIAVADGTQTSLGYMPYAVDGCAVAYSAPASASNATGELRLRDLDTGKDRVLEAEANAPGRPAIAGDLVAWEATDGGRRVVRFSVGGAAETISGSFDHAGEPRVAEGVVVFTGWLAPGDQVDTDVFLYDVASRTMKVVGGGAGQQRFADVSETHVAWSDFAESPSGVFSDSENDAADLAILDRGTGVIARRQKPGKQAFPMLGAPGKIAYLDWNVVHPEPKFSAYDLRLGDLFGSIEGDALVASVETTIYLRPVARGKFLDWLETSNGPVRLMRIDVDQPTPIVVKTFEVGSVLGPAADDRTTLLATRGASGPASLQSFER